MHEFTAQQIVLSSFVQYNLATKTYCGHSTVYAALMENSDLFIKCSPGERLFDASCVALILQLNRFNIAFRCVNRVT
jgi:hypothetical protein